jgi:hypothetical protein
MQPHEVWRDLLGQSAEVHQKNKLVIHKFGVKVLF